MNSLLWRVIYTQRASLQSNGFSAGPWHPDRAYVQKCAASLSRLIPVGVQSNQQAAQGSCTWPAQ